jgi:hypothetical protein
MDVISLDNLKSCLRQGKVEVTFRKVNGDIRMMTCTTNMDLIPPSSRPVGDIQEEKSHRRNVRVYDLDAQGWRSFIFDNVTKVEVLP